MRLLLGISAFAAVAAAKIYEATSFGQKDRLSEDGATIKGWQITGPQDDRPQVLSDRMILTPPWPGNRHGAVWSQQKLPYDKWTIHIDFRVSGQDRSGGNLQFWYTKENQNGIGSNNIYTVEKFDGLAVVVDSSGGTGHIRAFLNDGTTNFHTHHNIDSLPFAQCQYSYRNLGRQSRLTIQQDGSGMQITIDNHPCIRSSRVILPKDNYIGLSATSHDSPDSFEVFKLLTYDEATTPVMAETLIREQEHQHQQHQQQKVMGEHHDHEWAESDGLEHLDDALASSIRDQQAQFADLHDRLQTLSHNLDKVFVDMTKHRSHILSRVDSLNGPLAKTQQLTALENRLHELEQRLEQKIDQKFEQLRGEQKDWSGHFQTLENSLSTRHDALIASMPESMGQVLTAKGPNMKLFLGLFVLLQIILGLAYIVYKRRLRNHHQKYL